MSRISFSIVILNIVGLVLVQVLEAWRPGSVAGIVSIGGLLAWAICSTIAIVLVERNG